MEFAKGTIVVLKSGGPKMTIEGKNQLGRYICSWFHGDEVKKATFHPEALEEYQPTRPAPARGA